MPILHHDQIRQYIADMIGSVEAYCLLASLCAFVLIQPGIEIKIGKGSDELTRPSNNTALGIMLLDEALRMRKAHDYIENPTITSVMTSFFLFGCYFGLNKHNTTWFHLREATASAQILGMHDESYYLEGFVQESSRKRRLFWLLFITERAYALQKHRPLTLYATIELPKTEDDPTISVAGFIYLVQLYHPFDDTFVGLWNKSKSDCSTVWLAQLQRQLTQALPVYLDVAESQAVDLRTSQQWLRTMVWQLSITNGYLSSSSSDSSMTFGYPIEIAKDLVSVIGDFSTHSMEVHGLGLIEKVFDIACTLIDVMSCVPIESRQFELGPRDYLKKLIALISSLRGGETRYLPLLKAKMDDTLPPPAITPATHSPTLTGLSGQIEAVKLETYSNSSHSSPHSTPPYTQFYPLS
ncbi:hypothetical protein MMC07_004178 [Pseudocyphellaria aurata]|nr:hypothetical protein [Pseudocyphellaria aurata]